MQVAGDPEGLWSKLHSCSTQCERAGIDAVQVAGDPEAKSLSCSTQCERAGIDAVQVAGDPEAKSHSCSTQCERAGIDAVQVAGDPEAKFHSCVTRYEKGGNDVVQVATIQRACGFDFHLCITQCEWEGRLCVTRATKIERDDAPEFTQVVSNSDSAHYPIWRLLFFVSSLHVVRPVIQGVQLKGSPGDPQPMVSKRVLHV